MAIKYGFFDSINGDRKYLTSDFNNYFKGIIGEGVFPNPSSNLQVIANGTDTVAVKPGKYWHADGYWLFMDADLSFVVPTADVSYPRIDTIVIQLKADKSNRKFEITYKTGTPKDNPVPPPIDSTVTGEFILGEIFVAKNAVGIGQESITDKRTKVASLIESVDTSTLYNQYEAALNNFLTVSEDAWGTWFKSYKTDSTLEFITWFENLKETIGENTVTNLMNLISDLTLRVEALEDALLGNIGSHPYTLSFGSLENIVGNGVWNSDQQRIEC